jgi:putative membrane protein
MLTQSELGDLFVLRNAGNSIPTHGVPTGEEATIE